MPLGILELAVCGDHHCYAGKAFTAQGFLEPQCLSDREYGYPAEEYPAYAHGQARGFNTVACLINTLDPIGVGFDELGQSLQFEGFIFDNQNGIHHRLLSS